jgi:hypothetical protein
MDLTRTNSERNPVENTRGTEVLRYADYLERGRIAVWMRHT